MGEKEMPNLFDCGALIIYFNDVSGEPTELGTVVNGLSDEVKNNKIKLNQI